MSASAKLLMVAAVLLGGCPGKGGQGGAGNGGGGAGSGTGTAATSCDGLRAKIEAMYRAEAQAREPRRVEEAVADNTTMVLNDCAKDPTTVVACVHSVGTVAELERRCLAPLDDDGSEGDALRR